MTIRDALDTLGTRIVEGEQSRDAVHLAVLPIKAAHTLTPGTHVGIQRDGQATINAGKHVGIVDPFLPGNVRPGETFWLMLYPRTITSLQHVWTHPDIEWESSGSEETVNREASIQWLRNLCQDSEMPSYDTLIESARLSDNPDYLVIRGEDAYGDIPPEFWDHMEVVLGEPVAASRRATYFSCSC